MSGSGKWNVVKWLKLFCVALLCKIVATVFISYRDYMPPNFEVDFLLGRSSYFWNGYHWAFYIHIVSGPLSLLMGLFLISKFSRRRLLNLHRIVGRIQVGVVLLLVTPSGFWMAFHAQSGRIAGTAFMTLALLTGASVLLGWRAIMQRDYETHRKWMLRCFALLCSAIVLRVFGGFAVFTNLDAEWTYPLFAWACWLLPLAVVEFMLRSPGGKREAPVA